MPRRKLKSALGKVYGAVESFIRISGALKLGRRSEGFSNIGNLQTWDNSAHPVFRVCGARVSEEKLD